MHWSFACTKIRKNHFTLKNREWIIVEKMEEIYWQVKTYQPGYCMRMQNFEGISESHKPDWPKSIAIAMVTGQSGKVAAEILPKTA